VTDNAHDLPPGGGEALLEKIAGKVRNPHPERVVWQPAIDWKRQFYWLFWDEPKLGWQVVADLDRSNNAVSVTTKAPLAGLHVLLSDDVVDMKKEVVVLVNGVEHYRAIPERSLATLLMTGRYGDARRTYDARIPLF
jgi:hypothetical protein